MKGGLCIMEKEDKNKDKFFEGLSKLAKEKDKKSVEPKKRNKKNLFNSVEDISEKLKSW